MMDLRVFPAPLSLIFLAGLSCTTARAGDLDAAREVAMAALRAQLASSGELIATTTDEASPAPEQTLPIAPLPRPRLAPPARAVKHLPAAKDPVAHRLAVGFASTALPPEAQLPGPATPVEAAFALAYAEAEGADGTRSTSALSAIEALVEKHAIEHDVPPALAHALVQVESSYRPKATGRRGEIGLMQITPKTARAVGYKGPAKKLYDPETNVTYGMKYLAKAQKLAGGDLCGTLLRYNAGLDAKRKNSASTKFCAKVKKEMARRA